MSKYLASKTNGPGAAVLQTTRKGIYQFEQTTGAVALGAGTITFRRRLIVPQKVSRWRLHSRNINFLGNGNGSGTLNGFQVAVGQAADSTSQYFNGACTAAPVPLSAGGSQMSATLTAGSEAITDWYTPTSAPGDVLGNYKQTVFSFQYTAPTGSDQTCFGGGEQWYSVNVSADWLSAAMSSPTRVSSQAFLNHYLEFEFADDSVPVVLNLGNSLSGGGNGASPNYENRGELDSWGGQWLLRNRGVLASLAVAGAWAANFSTSDPRWTYYNTLDSAVPLLPDAITMPAFNSSDLINAGTWAAGNLTNAQLYMTQAIQKVHSMYPAARIILTNNPPRIASVGDGTAANTVENDRILNNKWLESSPLVVDTCVDIDRIATDWGNPARLRSFYDPGDGTHGRPRYYSDMAAAIGAAIHMKRVQ